MVSYRKRGNVWQYEISYKDPDGKYRKLRKSGFQLKSEAEIAASEIKSNYISARHYKAGDIPLADYFSRWVALYKANSVTAITLIKYQNTLQHIRRLFGRTPLKDLTRSLYQEKLNEFAADHAPRTVATFHKQIRAAILDALDEKIIPIDPTRKAVISGHRIEHPKKALDYNEWQRLVTHLDLTDKSDLIIYIAAVTGMRYAEIVGLTPVDLDVTSNLLLVNKTWDYKYHTGFKPTKTPSSVRKISINLSTASAIRDYSACHHINSEQPIFLENNRVPVSAEINKSLTETLRSLRLPRITFHGLRHTHASILLYQGINVLSVSKRLGHANITTTQSTYLHVIKELEEQDTDKIIQIISLS
ncbi:tyrosine-type recombinase/integrase [Lacticaseibacillus absianus]|uniref:site-specific integrase n=1 Tax=Lacticaseibacillus absianus TaxID=2729623 RepID=UPI0015C8A63B|nr:tyrosine-type recombinase/integrase [Lacticaseibacillus absianus]